MENSATTSLSVPLAHELANVARSFYAKGWAPATSTNYSVRLPREQNQELKIMITRSGIDKSSCQSSDMLLVDASGKCLPENGEAAPRRPSAETPLHLALYQYGAKIGAVVHSHSVASTVLSMKQAKAGKITLAGYEMLKGLAGIETHETTQFVPIFANDQDMEALGRIVVDYLRKNEGPLSGPASKRTYGVLIAGHGLYAWGEDLFAAKRHAEVYEFLFECVLATREVLS